MAKVNVHYGQIRKLNEELCFTEYRHLTNQNLFIYIGGKFDYNKNYVKM